MAEKSFDCLVIGSGMAGFSAVLHMKNRNKKVAIVSKGPGATAVSSGAWDFGPMPDDERLPFSQVSIGASWLDRYKKIFPGSCPVAGAEDTAREIARALAPDLKMVASFERPVFLPTSQGTWKKTFVAQSPHGNGSLDGLRGKKCTLFSSQNFRFAAQQVASSLQAHSKRLGVELTLSAREFPFFQEGSDFPLAQIAARLAADPQYLAKFMDWTIRNIRPLDADVVLMPPLFPSQKIYDAFQAKVGGTLAELLCVTEPIAGFRLHQAMESALSRLSVPKIDVTQVEGVERKDGRLLSLTFKLKNGTVETLRADHFILCSGKFFGGGVTLGYENIFENLLRLPLFLPGQNMPIHLRRQTTFKEEPFGDSQSWAAIGVRVNSAWQPVDELNLPAYQNLTACGSVLGGLDFAANGLGLGFMACSGREAALVLS